jgi:hypothetical protein
MARGRRSFQRKSAWVALCLALSISQGCARPGVFHRPEADSNSSAGDQNLPFHQTPDRAADDSARPAIPLDHKPETGAPFRISLHPRGVPAGTLITVQLQNSLFISRVRPGDAFNAVTGPLAIDGDTLIERGTPVSGRIESAQPAVSRPGLRPDPGYLRLSLNTITVDGKTLPLQTSSLFAQGTVQPSALPASNVSGSRSNDFRVLKGRRLTFRLTAPIILADPNSIANRQYSGASSP